jgi:hypothetical protein
MAIGRADCVVAVGRRVRRQRRRSDQAHLVFRQTDPAVAMTHHRRPSAAQLHRRGGDYYHDAATLIEKMRRRKQSDRLGKAAPRPVLLEQGAC